MQVMNSMLETGDEINLMLSLLVQRFPDEDLPELPPLPEGEDLSPA